jgi:hypothetical protein
MQLNTRLIAGSVSFCLALTGLFVANMFLTMMIGEINRRRQEGSLVSYLGFSFPKILRIFHEYRGAYPNGRMHIFALVGFTIALLGLVSVAVCLRIIG